MSRYATLITGNDGAEIVSAIGEFEVSQLPHRAGSVEEVAPGVRIGMVRGGTVDAIAGFGFQCQDIDGRGIGIVTTKLKSDITAGPIHEAASPAEAASPKPTPKSAPKPRRKKPVRRKAGKAAAAKLVPASDASARG